MIHLSPARNDNIIIMEFTQKTVFVPIFCFFIFFCCCCCSHSLRSGKNKSVISSRHSASNCCYINRTQTNAKKCRIAQVERNKNCVVSHASRSVIIYYSSDAQFLALSMNAKHFYLISHLMWATMQLISMIDEWSLTEFCSIAGPWPMVVCQLAAGWQNVFIYGFDKVVKSFVVIYWKKIRFVWIAIAGVFDAVCDRYTIFLKIK